ncbi:MAG: hypothetical protein ACI849_000026, partial [Patiriisocius sp.]
MKNTYYIFLFFFIFSCSGDETMENEEQEIVFQKIKKT